jgi:hypothetical protein
MREGNEKYHQTLIRDGLCFRPRLEHGTARIQVQRVAATPTRPFQFLNLFVTEKELHARHDESEHLDCDIK